MTTARDRLHPLLRALAVLPGAVLLLALVVGVLHHHAREDGSHSCAICSLSHALAVTTAAAPHGAPTVHHERVAIAPVASPVAAHLPSPSSRSPPSL